MDLVRDSDLCHALRISVTEALKSACSVAQAFKNFCSLLEKAQADGQLTLGSSQVDFSSLSASSARLSEETRTEGHGFLPCSVYQDLLTYPTEGTVELRFPCTVVGDYLAGLYSQVMNADELLIEFNNLVLNLLDSEAADCLRTSASRLFEDVGDWTTLYRAAQEDLRAFAPFNAARGLGVERPRLSRL